MKKGLIYNKSENTLTLGQVYDDGSFGEYIKFYKDETNTFQIKFLMGSDVAYAFLPKCEEVLELLEDGIVGVSIKMMRDELIIKGYQEI